jgi:hypothetical protein
VATLHVQKQRGQYKVTVAALKTMDDMAKLMKEMKPNTEERAQDKAATRTS